MRNTLRKSYLPFWVRGTIFALVLLSRFTALTTVAADQAEHLASFDPAMGFKPAQSDLTEVFLQIAGSLEVYGSPEPYLRHMKAEHARIETKYQTQLGDKQNSFCPAYMDAAYFDRFAANWKHIAPQLGLESLTRSTGRMMRLAINGSDGRGTILRVLFDEHSRQVHTAMTGKKAVQIPGFDAMKASLTKCLRLNEPLSPAADLRADQQAVVQPANEIRAAFLKLFSALNAGLAPADAEKLKTVILGIVMDVGRMALSETEAAIVEQSLDYRRSLQGPYSVEQETALSADERKTLADFVKKPRFTKADFPALEKFYEGPYDRLTERGKDELSKRIDAGMRPAR